MSLRDLFKRKKVKEAKKIEKRPKEKAKVEKPVELRPPKVRKEVWSSQAYKILKVPHVTEKASDLVKKNQYVFKVWPGANKVEVKKAIEGLFRVEVLGVRIINIPRKKRRLGRVSGFRKPYKKAIVRVKEGQKIEVLPR
jgi:large subunit ribosomal protein L23